MSYSDMPEYLVYELSMLYAVEEHLVEGLQVMLRQATDTRLQQCLSTHIDQTRAHATTLEQALSLLGRSRLEIANAAVQGLIDDARRVMDQCGTTAMRDWAIRGGAATAEHIEIARYTDLIMAADRLGQSQIVALLRQTLQQEQETAHLLAQLAPRLLAAAIEGTGESSRTGPAQPRDVDAYQPREIDAGSIEASGALLDESRSPLSEREHVP